MNEKIASIPDQVSQSTTHVVYSALRFLRLIRHRRGVMFASLLATTLLGVLYYATAERVYRANAELLLLKNDSEEWNRTIVQDGTRQGMMPTYEKLMTSNVVLQGALDRLHEMPPDARLDLVKCPPIDWIDELHSRVSASSVRATNLLRVSYESENPRTAESVVNSIVESFKEFIRKSEVGVADEINRLLTDEIVRNGQLLQDTNTKLLARKTDGRYLGIGEDSNLVHPALQKVSEIGAELIKAENRRVEIQSSLTALQSAIQHGGNLPQHLMALDPIIGREAVLGILGLSTKDNETTSRLESAIRDQRMELDQSLQYLGDNHQEIQTMRSNLAQLQGELATYHVRQMEAQQDQYNSSLGQMLEATLAEQLGQVQAHVNLLREEYQAAEQDAVQIAGQMAEIEMLEEEKDRLVANDKSLRNQLDELGVKRKQSDVRVDTVKYADADDHPVSPNMLWVAFLSLVSGALGGAVVVYVMDVLDDHFQSPEELKEQLGAPVLAMIRELAEPTPEAIGSDTLQVCTAPDSIESEAFRTLRTTLAFASESMDCLAVTSSEPGDGKTTVLANLGAAIAQAGRRTLLIDADMRRPGLSKLFHVRAERGLGDLLRGTDDVVSLASSFVLATGVAELSILPCGIRPSDPASMLASTRFMDLLAWAEAHYDQVLIDTPPIMAASDAAVIGRVADGLVLVVQPEKNHRQLVLRAAEEIHSAGIHFVGVVANRIGQGARQGYYSYGYGSGYGYGYGYGYGHDEKDAVASSSASARSTVTEAPRSITPAVSVIPPTHLSTSAPFVVEEPAAEELVESAAASRVIPGNIASAPIEQVVAEESARPVAPLRSPIARVESQESRAENVERTQKPTVPFTTPRRASQLVKDTTGDEGASNPSTYSAMNADTHAAEDADVETLYSLPERTSAAGDDVTPALPFGSVVIDTHQLEFDELALREILHGVSDDTLQALSQSFEAIRSSAESFAPQHLEAIPIETAATGRSDQRADDGADNDGVDDTELQNRTIRLAADDVAVSHDNAAIDAISDVDEFGGMAEADDDGLIDPPQRITIRRVA